MLRPATQSAGGPGSINVIFMSMNRCAHRASESFYEINDVDILLDLMREPDKHELWRVIPGRRLRLIGFQFAFRQLINDSPHKNPISIDVRLSFLLVPAEKRKVRANACTAAPIAERTFVQSG